MELWSLCRGSSGKRQRWQERVFVSRTEEEEEDEEEREEEEEEKKNTEQQQHYSRRAVEDSL